MKYRALFITLISSTITWLSVYSAHAELITCRTCGGSGTLHNGYTAGSMTCTTCSGSGREYSTATSVTPGYSYSVCPGCRGHRSVRLGGREQVCPQCNGAGEIAGAGGILPPGFGVGGLPGLPPLPVMPPASGSTGSPAGGSYAVGGGYPNDVWSPTTPQHYQPLSVPISSSSSGKNSMLRNVGNAFFVFLGVCVCAILLVFLRQYVRNKKSGKPRDIKTLCNQANQVIMAFLGEMLARFRNRRNVPRKPVDTKDDKS